MNAAQRTIEAVAIAWGISPDAILHSGRTHRVVEARSATVHILRDIFGYSYSEISQAVNRSNHTTAISAYKSAANALSERPAYRQLYERAIESLDNGDEMRQLRRRITELENENRQLCALLARRAP